jgi:DNA-binding NtrC family response regulator
MKKVILAGNCNFDGPQIKSVIEREYGVEVRDVKTMAEAMKIIDDENIDLVLVNRGGDQDSRNGLELVDYIMNKNKGPIILITNFQEKMDEAMEHGALEGFGKQDILNEAGLESVKKVLDPILE